MTLTAAAEYLGNALNEPVREADVIRLGLEDTLCALADAATFDPRTKARKIAQEQLQLQTVFDEEMKRANLWRMPNPGRMLHGLQ